MFWARRDSVDDSTPRRGQQLLAAVELMACVTMQDETVSIVFLFALCLGPFMRYLLNRIPRTLATFWALADDMAAVMASILGGSANHHELLCDVASCCFFEDPCNKKLNLHPSVPTTAMSLRCGFRGCQSHGAICKFMIPCSTWV